MKKLLTLLFFLFSTSTLAFDNGQYKDIDPATRSWFESVRSPRGIPCCSVADGHLTKWDMKENHYWVPIEGKWYEVPAEAVVRNAGNPFAEAVVWYVRQYANGEPKDIFIRCFVPASEI